MYSDVSFHSFLFLLYLVSAGLGVCSLTRNIELFLLTLFLLTTAWLAQLVKRQSAVREVEGSSPRPDQHSGS